ncbi:MAG: hypothetical protein HYZ91_07060 [Candidatus Omnitrophica bacterium]|nr:hypothetical protein [Candidatus Omnitrophota bacterium]
MRKTLACPIDLHGQAGNAYIEYFVIALIVMLATVAFYSNGRFGGGLDIRGRVEGAFDNLVTKVLAP